MSRMTGKASWLLHVLVLNSVVWIFTSCDETPTGTSDYKFLGVYQVKTTYLDIKEQIGSQDTLVVYLEGDTDPSGYLSLSHIETVRDSFQLELTVWAEVRRWIGEGPPPPCYGCFWYEYEVLPPFYPGYFRVIVDQPDGTVLDESTLVEP